MHGTGLDLASSIKLGGVAVPSDNVTRTQRELPFGADLATAAQWRGSYALVVDGATRLAVYADAPIPDPTSPPPPPAGPDCPCIAGWEASGIPNDNFTWCYYGTDGTQNYIYGQRDEWFIASAFDPNDLLFDPAGPGNSVSFFALHDGVDYTAAEPVVNEDQYWDCELYLWVKICI